jgi:hypothetical protein
VWQSARRLRHGARAVFHAAAIPLDNDSLLNNGEWIDDAVADLLAP